ncbi:MAG: pitrilysin family protein, partial [Nanoarchaeota archaeon]
NGITILFEERELPLVCYSISNPFGGSHETSDIKGVAHLFEHLLFTGTKTKTQEELSKQIEKRGGILNAFTAQDFTTYWCKLPSEHLDICMDILHDILKNPTFNPEKLEKEKKVVLEEIKLFHDDPERHIYELIEQALYKPPFNEGIIGSAKTVNSLTREKIVHIFEEKYSPENFIVVVVGKANIKKICERLEKDFNSQKKSYSYLPIENHHQNIVEERAGIDQAQFIWATHAPLEQKKQYSLEIINAYLTGGMSAKLWLEIREKHGLAYTVRGSIEREKNYSYYSIYVGTTKEAVPKIKDMIIQGIKDVEEMTIRDLAEAKQRLIGLRRVATEESINAMQKLIFTEISTSNAHEYYEYEKHLDEITLEEVKLLAKSLLKEYSTATILPKNGN